MTDGARVDGIGTDEAGISRRAFLIGAAGVAGLAVVGVAVWRVTESDGSNRWEVLFGDSTDAVAEIGKASVDAGIVQDANAAIEALPTTGVSRDGDTLTITDADAFAASFHESSLTQTGADDLVELEAWFFAPVELALAALVHLDA